MMRLLQREVGRVRLRGLSLAGLAVLVACQGPTQKLSENRDIHAEAVALTEGLPPRHACRTDRDCRVGQAEAACVLGSCFGLLSADSRPTRQVLAERLQSADNAVRAAAAPLLLHAMATMESPAVHQGAIAGLGALLLAQPEAPGQCGAVCLALRAESASLDEHQAAAARIALGLAGDDTATAALREDLTTGTELLRAEAARALAPALLRPAHEATAAALTAALRDPSPLVAEAAVHALAAARKEPAVREGLTELQTRQPHLAYAIAQLLRAP